jgi:hypothetical protein
LIFDFRLVAVPRKDKHNPVRQHNKRFSGTKVDIFGKGLRPLAIVLNSVTSPQGLSTRSLVSSRGDNVRTIFPPLIREIDLGL